MGQTAIKEGRKAICNAEAYGVGAYKSFDDILLIWRFTASDN